ncbi:3-hydroxyacyl-CoA dehydrogenase/enoyl-CoA hydratase family protein [Fluviispira sanaruensis]|uniref:3-hydroxyacyl-CoA dehydrogenase n=1 Tax=Fluviispira sanaruensis TaxID=2493639 RepID=A0A4P2VI65_FLUSA|nr:3-hydroxyacyl-CoA dehydrogenase/enoyl-CoA hydratase family protein [Fluviispira sanaruensis]BBH52078.1 3-hydroxyacyl-CoA dehydrogenase [Fluviispira sanaruensis]
MASHNRYLVRKVAVLGSGVMGAQIAAHMANANVDVVLFDLPAKDGNPNGIVQKSLAFLQKLEPTPFSVKSKANYITPANYEHDLDKLTDCDLIIEAISERMDWKKDLYTKVSGKIAAHAIFATNTSGLSINSLAEVLPAELRKNFCGIHFFNPPRYMTLVEIIPQKHTNLKTMDNLEEFLTTVLGKGVIRAKDTPNFIANRIGVFSMLATMHHTEKFSLGFDVVDALTGTSIGRAKSATYRTLDVVGIDTLAHVIKTMSDTLPSDPWHSIFNVPTWIQALISKGAVGQKAGGGVFRKVGKEIHVLDLKAQEYRLSKPEADADVVAILKLKDPSEKFKQLKNSQNPQAQFLWAIFRDLFHYCAVQLEEIADNARDLDLAIRWGYGWAMGPFETWQAAGWKFITDAINEDIAAGKTVAKTPLPAWVTDGRSEVHFSNGSYSPSTQKKEPRRELPVYARQFYPERVLGEKAIYGETVYENDGVRLWTKDDEISILSFKSKMHAIGSDVLEGVIKSVKIAEEKFKGLVLWQSEPPFSAGANLAQVTQALKDNDFKTLETMVKRFQDASMALKHSLVPTVAAVQGLALGGGCEFVMHCSKAVAALETYMGLVEVGVGLLPAGGGCKEFTLRAAKEAKGGNIFPFLQKYFENIAMAKVSRSAEDAKELGYLRPSDTIVFNPNELLYVATQEVKSLYEAGYRPPLKSKDILVTGKGGTATFKAALVNMLAGGFISEHDHKIGSYVATILGGGDIDQGNIVTDEWLLELEFRFFMELLRTEKTQQRIKYMLENGKPLRN